ncbi:MAG: site-specific integrase [Nitrospiraceae bacterium]
MARPHKKDKGIYARKDADGNTVWYCRAYLDGREQRIGPFTTKTDATNKYQDLKAEHRAGRVDPHGGWMLVEDLFDRHLSAKADKKDQATQQRLATFWKARFKAHGIKRVKDLTIRFLEETRDELKAEWIKQGPTRRARKPRKTPVRKEPMREPTHRTPGTINRYFAWLRSALKPVKQIRRALFDDWTWEKESKGRTRHLDPKEEARLLAALGPIYGPWARFAILTGLRQAEQFGLKWADVDFEQGLITLPETKSGHVQHVYLSDEAAAILRGLDSWSRSKWVFPSIENPASHYDARNFFGRVWVPAVKRAEIEWATWHDLRHTFASRLAMSGQNASTIAALLRHSGLDLVKRYAHLNQPHLKQAAGLVAQFGQTAEGVMGSGTGKKPETGGSVGERSGGPEAAEVGVTVGEKIGAPDTN